MAVTFGAATVITPPALTSRLTGFTGYSFGWGFGATETRLFFAARSSTDFKVLVTDHTGARQSSEDFNLPFSNALRKIIVRDNNYRTVDQTVRTIGDTLYLSYLRERTLSLIHI